MILWSVVDSQSASTDPFRSLRGAVIWPGCAGRYKWSPDAPHSPLRCVACLHGILRQSVTDSSPARRTGCAFPATRESPTAAVSWRPRAAA